MSNRRSFVLVSVAVLLVALAVRLVPLYWSPLPFNLDGFHFAVLVRETLATGHVPLSHGGVQSDEYAFTTLFAITSRITGIPPLYIAQYLTASIGAISCLFVVVLTRRVGRRLRWPRSDVRTAAAVAGLVLATDGIFLGRSAAVSSEGMGHVFVIMGVFVFGYALWTNRPAWYVLTGSIFFILPLTHNLSTIVGVLSAISLLALFLKRSESGPNVAAGALIVGFGVYTGLYYTTAGLPDARVSSALGLFAAWIIVLVVLTLWLPSIDPRLQRGVPTLILFGGAGLVVGNYFLPIFPGTASTRELTMVFVLSIAAIGIVAARGTPLSIREGIDGYAVVAMLLASLSLIGFALTGGLTPEYQALAVRTQTFVHLPFAILAGLGTVAVGLRRRTDRLKVMLAVIVIVCSVISAPLAYSGLRATSAQPLVTKPEMETATFASTYADQWTGDGHMTRLASRYYPERTGNNVTQRGVYEWLRGSGAEPSCPVVSRRSWSSVGVQLFPGSPAHISATEYDRFNDRRNVVYSVSGRDPVVYSVSRGNTNGRC
ncbi:sodium/phosphate symporter [Haladaptatus sp. AB618]|uniref:sodium/phosphate symporter n=1 Tax=Haladaptatus sp. AB618 TaxID=2934173 RepID=UPI00209C2CAE|nr:sodium/phosphate symporter [Haladaptatus sp. AB618]MCO8255726.1 sodium/phosphate symporter [Haladaptatus sp. AB618]